MKRRKVGKSGIEIAPLAFGCNIFGWTVDDATAFQLLDSFVEAGFNLIDTADVYSKWVPGNKGGESEIVIGKWLKQSGKRSEVVIATKVGMEMKPGEKGLSRSYIRQAIEASLTRLQTDYVDIYQSHADDPQTPLEETLGAYAELMREGKMRAIGASNYPPDRLSTALELSKRDGYPRYESYQPLFNLYDNHEYQANFESLCVREELGVLTYSSLASGFLTGKYRSTEDLTNSGRGQDVADYLNPRGFRILKALDDVAGKYESTPARVALAWLMARPSITAPIASATSLRQLHELFEATRLQLDQSSLQTLTEATASPD